jgi:hypothetical protein
VNRVILIDNGHLKERGDLALMAVSGTIKLPKNRWRAYPIERDIGAMIKEKGGTN